MNDDNRIQPHISQKAPYIDLQLDGAGADARHDPGSRVAATTRVELLTRRARSFYAMHQWDKAIADCQEALKLSPNCDTAILGLADCYQCKRDFHKAIDLYTQAIALVPNNAYAYAWRGSAQCHLNQFAAALADYNEAIRLAPNEATYYSARGTVYSSLGKHDLAMKDHDRAFQLAEGFRSPPSA